MNLHTLPRTFYLTRHGQSEYNLLGKIGGDSGLTAAGVEYARRLAQFAKEQIASMDGAELSDVGQETMSGESGETGNNGQGRGNGTTPTGPPPRTFSGTRKERPCRLWTSTLRRTKETAAFIEHNTFQHVFDNGDKGDWVQFRPMPRRNLDELYAGVCDGMTYKEIEQVYPEEFKRRQKDKLAYRYPRGMLDFCWWMCRLMGARSGRIEFVRSLFNGWSVSLLLFVCSLFHMFLFHSYSMYRRIVHGCHVAIGTLGPRNGTNERARLGCGSSRYFANSVCLFHGIGST